MKEGTFDKYIFTTLTDALLTTKLFLDLSLSKYLTNLSIRESPVGNHDQE